MHIGNLKGSLAEEAACCSHHQWWRNSLTSAARRQYPANGIAKHYAPNMPFHVRHVKLALKVEPAEGKLSGTCFTTIEPIAKPLTSVFFQAQDLTVSRASIAGAADSLPLEAVDDGYRVTLPAAVKPGDKVEIALAYAGVNPKAGIYFTGPDSSYQEPYQVWTQGQDEDAHYWFPVAGADFPNHKMTSEVIVTAPKRYTALSNGKLVLETVDEAAGTRTSHWVMDKPHVCYLIAMIVGVFAKLEKNFEEIPVQLFCDPERLADAKEYFEGTDTLVALYSRLYGVKYPWSGKYAQVMVRRFIFGGMENTTMTVMTDRILADHTTREEYRKYEIRLNAHELNHDWNGDYVTCRDWSHAWLNEGGATYGEVEAIEHFYGKLERDYYVKGLADTYFAEDRLYRRPIVSPYYNEPIDLFDRHLYQKGGLVRHMLRYLLGDEGYYSSIKTYLTDNAFQPVETHDLIKAIEKTTGVNLREFFDQWVYGAGFPEYGVTYSYDDSRKVATVKVSQNQKLEDKTGLFTMPIVFSFGFADGSHRDFTMEVKDQQNSFHFPLAEKPVMFRFDPDNWVLKTVSLAVPKSMLLHQLANDPSVMGRVHACQALAKLGGADVVEALEKAAQATFFWGVSCESAKALGTIGSAKAGESLKRVAAHASPFVRRAAVNALGNFKDAEAAILLAQILSGTGEKSVFVRAEAAAALGKTKVPFAFAALEEALSIPSWNETVRVGVLNGLAELADNRGVPLAIEYASALKPWSSRPAAIAALGKLGLKHDSAVDHLHVLAQSEDAEQFTVRMALVGALGEAKRKESVAVLSRLKSSAHDGRVKRVIADTIATIEAAKDDSKPVDELKAKVEKLTTQVRDLSDQLQVQTAGAAADKK